MVERVAERGPYGFPVQGESRRDHAGSMHYVPSIRIPWSVAEVAYAEYARRFGGYHGYQMIERIAGRGGFGRDELLTLLARAAEREVPHG